MPIRMTGMISGLDTDTLIQSMVDAQRMKNKRVEDKKTLIEWKQERWKELNTKLYKLYTTDLNKMRLQSSYLTKSTTSSNEDLVSVNAKANAPTGTHTLQINNLASSKSITGDKLDASTKANSKLTDLGVTAGTIITVTHKDEEETLKVTSSTTINDFVNLAKSAGLNASFDETYKRFYISAKNSGTENDFKITASASIDTDKSQIQSLTGYENLSVENKASVDNALNILADVDATNEDKDLAIETLSVFAEAEVERQVIEEITPNATKMEETKIQEEVLVTYLTDKGITEDELNEEQKLEIKDRQEKAITSAEGQARIEAAIDAAVIEAKGEESYQTRVNTAKAVLGNVINSYQSQAAGGSSDVTGRLDNIGLGSNAHVIDAVNSEIIYNGVSYTGSSNVFNINGMEFTLKGKGTGETIYLNVENNTKGIYDMVKNFVSSYNDILKEMNDLYYAESARGYDPLSDDEKEAMTESQIEKWEKKIKDSILRRDGSLGSLLDSMKSAMITSVEVDGKRYSLSSFGIQTSAVYTERGLLHIFGDEDDASYSAMENKLMKAIEEDSDVVMEVLSQISQNLYSTMNEKMKAIPNVRSAFTFYNDKIMTKQQTDYEKQIAKLEAKVLAMEEKYYKQFAAMETAMAKMQEQSNALAGMLGMSNR